MRLPILQHGPVVPLTESTKSTESHGHQCSRVHCKVPKILMLKLLGLM